MGLNINNKNTDLNPFKDIGKETLSAVNTALKSDGQITAAEITGIEKAAKSDGKFSDGEKLLISYLKEQTKDNKVIKNLSFFDNEINPEPQPPGSDDTADIKAAAQSFKQTNKFTDSFFKLDRANQKLAVELLKNLTKNPPLNQAELKKIISGQPEEIKTALGELGLNNLAPEKDPAKLLSEKTIKKLPVFLEKSVQLSDKEKDIALKTMSLLVDSPPAPDYKIQIKAMMDSLGKDKSMLVGKTLNSLGVYIPSTTLSAPTSEDATSRIKTVQMGDYSNASIQGDYIRDVLKVAQKEGFIVSVQASREKPVQEIKKTIISDLQKFEGLSEQQATELVNKHLKITEGTLKGYEWAEDNKFMTVGGEIKTFPVLEKDYDSAVPLTKTLAFTTGVAMPLNAAGFTREGIHTAGLDNHDPKKIVDERSLQGAVTDRNEQLGAIELAGLTGKRVTTTRTYNEGGNMLLGVKPNGDSYSVIGRDGLLISTFHLEHQFSQNPENVPEFKKLKEKISALEKAGNFTPELVADTINRLKAADEVPAGIKPEQRAKEFLARMDIVKNDIFPKDIGIPPENIIFVAQPDFHIDMHLRPLLGGKIMVNDFDSSLKLLQEAKTKVEKGSWQDKEIDSMIEHTEKTKKVMDPVMAAIGKKLTNAGLEVVKAPGVMQGAMQEIDFKKNKDSYDLLRYYFPEIASKFKNQVVSREMIEKAIASDLKENYGVTHVSTDTRETEKQALDTIFTRNVNFMNAVPGTTTGTNRRYYMTNHSSIKPIRDLFEAEMKKNDIDKVYWIGDSGGGKNTLSGAETSLNSMGGMDCRENHEEY